MSKKVAFFPTNDQVVILPDEQELVTKGGIHLPDSTRVTERPRKGTVVAVGPGAWNQHLYKRDPMPLERGDTVYFAQWSGNEIEEDGMKYLFMPQSQVLAVVSKEKS